MYSKENQNHIYKDGTVMCVYIDLHRYAISVKISISALQHFVHSTPFFVFKILFFMFIFFVLFIYYTFIHKHQ